MSDHRGIRLSDGTFARPYVEAEAPAEPVVRHPSNVGNHPVMADRENCMGVFSALLETLPEADRGPWVARWGSAVSVERARRDYDRDWDSSLLSIHRSEQ